MPFRRGIALCATRRGRPKSLNVRWPPRGPDWLPMVNGWRHRRGLWLTLDRRLQPRARRLPWLNASAMSWKSVRNFCKMKHLQSGEIYLRHDFEGPVEEPERAAAMLLEEQQKLVQLERALLILEGSSAINRVTNIRGTDCV